MKKVKILFFTTTITVDGESSAQDQFSITQEVEDDLTNDDIAENVASYLNDSFGFVEGDEKGHYYKTSTITDFIIKEIKE